MKSLTAILTLTIACVAASAWAQMPKMPSMGGVGGMPDVSKMGVGNATGALSYCVKNKVLGGSDATSTLNALSGKPEVKSAPGYADGQTGKLDLGSGSSFSLDGVQGQAKSQVCNMVLKQAKTFL